ncbi:protein Tob1 [Glossina fuscipes]|uniref:Protein Tob1 n=1 Tax=Glossina fuscipes TaxID=7396 RepID=A0A9C5Z3V5_9MUSC|nr:protein Tob1 [Glossina fuscipes]KAI9578669.1 hypothetical protein GQX74_009243 [Glossina fuscipes]
MRGSTMQEWMSNEIERFSSKLERYKPTGSGYNRIQPIRLSKSVVHMLNNPMPNRSNQIEQSSQVRTDITQREQQPPQQGHLPQQPSPPPPPPAYQHHQRSRGVLSLTPNEWEEMYPTVEFHNHRTQI